MFTNVNFFSMELVFVFVLLHINNISMGHFSDVHFSDVMHFQLYEKF